MNIFKVLANGYGNINENNVSAFLGYLLDPRADHGLNDEFLKLFLKPLGDKYFTENENISFDNLSVNSDYLVEIFFEKEFGYLKEKPQKVREKRATTQRIDIIIKISKKPDYTNKGEVIFLKPVPLVLILLENKISFGSFTKEQLLKQQAKLKAHLRSEIERPSDEKDFFEKLINKCFSIYVTPDSNVFLDSFEGAINEKEEDRRISGVHWCWDVKNIKEFKQNNNKKRYNGIITELISKLFENESLGLIEPMNEITKHTLKAFNNYIKTNFESKIDEGKGSYASLELAIAEGGELSTISEKMKEYLLLLENNIKEKDQYELHWTKSRLSVDYNGSKIYDIKPDGKDKIRIHYVRSKAFQHYKKEHLNTKGEIHYHEGPIVELNAKGVELIMQCLELTKDNQMIK